MTQLMHGLQIFSNQIKYYHCSTAVQYEELLTQFQNSLSQTALNNTNKNDNCQLARRIAKNLEATFTVAHIFFKFCSPSFHSIGCVHCDIWKPERLFCGVITVEKCGVLQHAATPLPSFHPSPPPNSAPGSCISISQSCIAQCVVCSVRCPSIQNAPGYYMYCGFRV